MIPNDRAVYRKTIRKQINCQATEQTFYIFKMNSKTRFYLQKMKVWWFIVMYIIVCFVLFFMIINIIIWVGKNDDNIVGIGRNNVIEINRCWA